VTPLETMRTNVLSNDSDPDGDALTVRPNANRTAGGTFRVAADGAFAYTPNYGFAGRDRVGYEVSDGRGGSDTATVWIHVVNAAPVVEDEHHRIRPGATLRGNLLANDHDPDGDTITVTSRLDVKLDGDFTWTPAPGFVGRESFGYAVKDQYGLITGGRIVIDVVNEAPVAANHRLRIRNDETAGGNVLVGARDPDGDPVRLHPFSVTAEGRSQQGGLVRIDRDGGFNYLPPAGFVGSDRFGYSILDSYQARGDGSVTVEVAANKRPLAGDDKFTTRPDPTPCTARCWATTSTWTATPSASPLSTLPSSTAISSSEPTAASPSHPTAPGWTAASRSTTRSPTVAAAATSPRSTSTWSTERRSRSTTASPSIRGAR
jgi:hypothetical protein